MSIRLVGCARLGTANADENVGAATTYTETVWGTAWLAGSLTPPHKICDTAEETKISSRGLSARNMFQRHARSSNLVVPGGNLEG